MAEGEMGTMIVDVEFDIGEVPTESAHAAMLTPSKSTNTLPMKR